MLLNKNKWRTPNSIKISSWIHCRAKPLSIRNRKPNKKKWRWARSSNSFYRITFTSSKKITSEEWTKVRSWWTEFFTLSWVRVRMRVTTGSKRALRTTWWSRRLMPRNLGFILWVRGVTRGSNVSWGNWRGFAIGQGCKRRLRTGGFSGVNGRSTRTFYLTWRKFTKTIWRTTWPQPKRTLKT